MKVLYHVSCLYVLELTHILIQLIFLVLVGGVKYVIFHDMFLCFSSGLVISFKGTLALKPTPPIHPQGVRHANDGLRKLFKGPNKFNKPAPPIRPFQKPAIGSFFTRNRFAGPGESFSSLGGGPIRPDRLSVHDRLGPREPDYMNNPGPSSFNRTSSAQVCNFVSLETT